MARTTGAGTSPMRPAPDRADAGQQCIRCRAIGDEEGLALGRDTVLLAAGVLGFDCGVSHVMEPGQGRIDHARARRVAAAKAFFDRFDELVTVARPLGHHRQEKETQLAVIEGPTAAPAAVMMPVASATMVIGKIVGWGGMTA